MIVGENPPEKEPAMIVGENPPVNGVVGEKLFTAPVRVAESWVEPPTLIALLASVVVIVGEALLTRPSFTSWPKKQPSEHVSAAVMSTSPFRSTRPSNAGSG